MTARERALHLQAIQRLCAIVMREADEPEESPVLLHWLGMLMVNEAATLQLLDITT